VRHASVFQILKGLPGLYAGRHLENTKYVFMLRGRKITAEPVHASDEILLDVDGEAPGRLPATFEIVPRALLLKY
ncbi:MAG TPA: diacylglycerol kinase family lipid kinase, partial [Candidatus Hydrogenedentes bacterium]|nr:diacylglycerol kinase family lipid kinase [Candidatus Hydrogenedentota bacterium]